MKRTIICFVCFILVNMAYTQKQSISIELVNGISFPNSKFKDFVEDGFNNELSINKSFCEHLSLGMGVKHSSFNVRQEFGQVGGSRKQFRSIGFDVGPQFSFGSDKLSVQIYGRTGLSINSTPELSKLHPNTDIATSNIKQESLKALSARLGAKINTELCKGIQLFLSSEYATALNGDHSYYSKDISKAIGADGRIDPDLASEIPTTSTSFKFSSFNINFGVSIAMGKCGNHPNRRNSNPLYKGNQNKGENPMYQERGHNNNPLYEQSGIIGNNPMYEQGIGGGGGQVGQSSGSRAQDYNSSRSNTTTAIELEEDKEETDKNMGKAQDYNSSRNNNSSSSISNPNDGNTKAVQAQDYNSSRSNISTAIELEDHKEETDKNMGKAQDYNSSRSNNSSSSVSNPNNGSTKAVQAQDYNSSRSNTTSAIDTSDDIRESMLASQKRKIKRKLRKEERKRVKEEKKRRKLQANEIY